MSAKRPCGLGRPRREAVANLGLGVSDPGGQLLSGKPAKDDRVDGADADGAQHSHQRLGHHGHVDEDTIPLLHAHACQQAGQPGHLVLQLAVGQLVLPEIGGNIRTKEGRGQASF